MMNTRYKFKGKVCHRTVSHTVKVLTNAQVSKLPSIYPRILKSCAQGQFGKVQIMVVRCLFKSFILLSEVLISFQTFAIIAQ